MAAGQPLRAARPGRPGRPGRAPHAAGPRLGGTA